MNTDRPDIIKSGRLTHILEEVPLLFQNFPPDNYREILQCGELHVFNSGEVVLSKSENQVNKGWLVAEGQISIHLENIHVQGLKPGDFFGETFFFRKQRNLITVIAETDASLISFDREMVLQYFREHSDRLFKIFIMNLLKYQNEQLVRILEKYAQLQKSVMESSNRND